MGWVEVGELEGDGSPWERRGKGKVSGGDGRDDGRAATNACTVVFLGGRRTANDATPPKCQNSREKKNIYIYIYIYDAIQLLIVLLAASLVFFFRSD